MLPFEHLSISSEDCNQGGILDSFEQENDKLLPVCTEFCCVMLPLCSMETKVHHNRIPVQK